MSLFNKVKWILGIFVIFLLIITTNLIDKNNFTRVKEAVVTIYEDRLVAKDIIFEISKLIHYKELALFKNDASFFAFANSESNEKIDDYIIEYQKTQLTRNEGQVFSSFLENISGLNVIEKRYLVNNNDQKIAFADQIKKIKKNLYNLSEIQLTEGKNQLDISKKALETIDLYTQIEIYFLILLAIIIQIIVLYTPKVKS
jgi:DNA gyrase/topoisomerase IV subunit A